MKLTVGWFSDASGQPICIELSCRPYPMTVNTCRALLRVKLDVVQLIADSGEDGGAFVSIGRGLVS